MADSTYQRTVSDLESAGLNPMLALRGTDPSATITAAPVVNELGAAMNNGIGNYSALQSANQSSAQANVSNAQVDNVQSQTNLNTYLAAKAAADTTSALSAARVSNAQADKISSGSLMSDVIGSTAAAKTSQYLNSAMDTVTNKVKSLVQGITANSASKVQSLPLPPPAGSPSNSSDSSGWSYGLPDVSPPSLSQ